MFIILLSGNCPLGQAIPRIKKIWPDSSVKSVLSLAMPQFSNSSGAMKNIQTQWGKNLSALKYLFSQMTDGEPVFKKVKDDNPSTLFLRQRPTLEKSAEIPMDEADGERMIQGFLSFKSAQRGHA